MKNFELKATLLNNLETYGRELIEKALKTSDSYDYDLYIYATDEGDLSLLYEYEIDSKDDIKEILYNFGHNCAEQYQEYKDTHSYLLEIGEIVTEDFERWFENECDLSSDIDTYEEIIQDKIEELFPESEIEKEKQEEQNKNTLHSYVTQNCMDYVKKHGFDFEKNFYTLCDEFAEFLNEEFEVAKLNNKTRKMNQIINHTRNLLIIKDLPLF